MTDSQEPREDGQAPLEGLRVLAIEQMQSMPFATELMARLGARVVKIEHPVQGDSGRGSQPAVADDDGNRVGATYLRNNLGKASVGIDLKTSEGQDLVRRLARNADVVAENFRPGMLAGLGLGYEAIAAVHPAVVYVSISGFGNLGQSPYQSWPAYAPVAEAMSGIYEYNRPPDRPPIMAPVGALGDTSTGLFAVIGVLSALRRRDLTGRGTYVDVAMLDSMVAMADVVPNFWSLGLRGNMSGGALGVFAPFRAKDGWFVVQALREHQLQRLAQVIDHEEWLTDPRLATRQGWTDHLEDIIRPAVEQWASTRTKLQAATELAEAGIASGPCNTAENVVADPHIRDHNMLVAVPRPDADEPVLAVGNPIKFAGMADRELDRWPRLGEHTWTILRDELGIDDSELDRLAASGVITPSHDA
jgi:crotonobetainyl-CoA:carnitine CoA-transferase CaiB-like acyl-CoA transferase